MACGVWLAVEDATGEPVALKRLPLADGPRLRREGAVLAAFRHPHVVVVRGLLATDAGAALVLQLAAGGSLADALSRVGRLRCGEVVGALAPVADALAAAHEAGLVHGHLSLDDVLLDSAGVPLLAGLGTARLIGDEERPVRSGHVGPVSQADGEPGPASDVYGLAAVAVRCLLGEASSGAEGPPSGWAGQAFGQGVPASLVAALAAGLDRQPGRRPSAGELADAFRATCGPLALHRLLESSSAGDDGRPLAGAPPLSGEFAPVGEPALPGAFALPLEDDPWRPFGGAFENEPSAGRRRWVLASLVGLAALVVFAGGWLVWPSGRSVGAPHPPSTPGRSVLTPPRPSAGPSAGASGGSVLSPAEGRSLLVGFDQRRAAAFAGAAAGPLAGVYLAGSAPHQADLRSVRWLAAGRIRAVGVRHEITAVTVEAAGAGRAVVRAVDRATAYRVLDAAGRVLRSVPRRPPATVEFSLVAVGSGWRIATITSRAVASPAAGGAVR